MRALLCVSQQSLHAARKRRQTSLKACEIMRSHSRGMHLLQILVIAVLMKWVLKRTFSIFQWEALLLLVAGITVNQLNYCK